MINPPEYIRAIKPYQPGKPVEELERELGIEGAVKLASNENPLGPSPKALDAIKRHLSGLNRYPDGSGYYLKNALAERLGVEPDELILGNGSNELLDIAVRTFMRQDDHAVMGAPSFVVYPLAVQSVGAEKTEVPLSQWRHDLEGMLSAVKENTKILFIANPNNPTGTINRAQEFKRLMERLPEDILLIVDEAYYEYVTDNDYPDSLSYFREGRNILILRTFSKAYGLAGLRIGYGIGRKEVLVEMNKIREPFNTNSLGQVAALAALEDEDHIIRSIEVNNEGKEYLYREFERLGIEYVPTEANFIFVPRLSISAGELYEKLLRRGVIIRPMGPEWVRITIGLMDENKRLIQALEAELGKGV
ncbi:MAG: histidinol-phosphate transaminase [Nitrospirae bacterium]|nr:MAG: histidinol-phosphate transaminase [Nitrospirota bacterium]